MALTQTALSADSIGRLGIRPALRWRGALRQSLERDDWHWLEYHAALDLRTPASYVEHTGRWKQQLPSLLAGIVNGWEDKLRRAASSKERLRNASHQMTVQLFPDLHWLLPYQPE